MHLGHETFVCVRLGEARPGARGGIQLECLVCIPMEATRSGARCNLQRLEQRTVRAKSQQVHYYTEDKGWSSCMERNVDAARVKWEPGGSMN